jgi:hypothetical protein
MEATQKLAQDLKISKKVNYDALKQLLGDDGDGNNDSGAEAAVDGGGGGDDEW